MNHKKADLALSLRLVMAEKDHNNRDTENLVNIHRNRISKYRKGGAMTTATVELLANAYGYSFSEFVALGEK